MPYVVSLTPTRPYMPGVTAVGYTAGTFSTPITVNGERIASVLNSGTPIDPDMVPRNYTVEVKADALPDVFSLKFGYGVTDRFREKVEELEPGVHQFFAVEITAKGGERPKQRHWLLHVCNRVSAINPEKTTLPLGPGGHKYMATEVELGQPMGMELRKEPIAGKCIWIDREFMGIFISDELFDFVQKNKMTKFHSWKVEAR